MDIRILDKEEQRRIYPEAYEMLAAADNEFVPLLSSRSSSTQQDFSQAAKNDSIIQYFDQLKNQRFAAAFEDGALIAKVLENDRGNGIDTVYFKKSHK